MSGDERDVEITRFADRLAIVHRLEHRQQARVFLHRAGKGVEVSRATMSTQRLPLRQCSTRGAHGGIDVGITALRNLRQRGGGCGVVHRERLAMLGERAVDEVPEGAELVAFEPFAHRRIALGGGAVGHGLEDVGDGSHVRGVQWVTASVGDTLQRTGR